MLYIQMLGEFSVRDDSHQSLLISRRPVRMLLAYLLLHRDRPIPVEELFDAIWPEMDTSKARGNLRRNVYFLLKLLPEAPADKPWLVRNRKSIQWSPNVDVQLDFVSFGDAVQRGRLALDAGLLSDAESHFAAAIQQYSGPLLPESEDTWIEPFRDDYRARYSLTLETMVRLLVESDDLDLAMLYAVKHQETSASPQDAFHLRVWLEAALNPSGDALILADEWEEDSDRPDLKAETRELLSAIREGKSIAAWRPRVLAKDARAAELHDRGGRGTINHLPETGDAFIGRGDILDALRKSLIASRLLTLLGAGGAGKTRLAIELCRQVQGTVKDGVYWIDLVGLETERHIEREIATALGIRQDAKRSLMEQICESISQDACVLVFDNCEQVVEPVGVSIGQILSFCPAVKIITTSRIEIGIEGEKVFPVPPLEVPSTGVALEGGLRAEASQLFLARVGEAWPELEITPARQDATIKIAQLVEGIPLALELAAARVGVLDIDEVANHLESSYLVLSRHDNEHPARHETLEVCIDWSFRLLTEREQCLLRRISIFAGAFEERAVARICALAGRDDFEEPDGNRIPDLLEHLGRSSFLQIGANSPGRTQFLLMEMIRQFGRRRLKEIGEYEQVAEEHALYHLELAEEIAESRSGASTAHQTERLDAVRADILATMRWAKQVEDWDFAARLGIALFRYWAYRGHLDLERQWLRAIIDKASQTLEPERASRLCRSAAVLAYFTALFDEAKEDFELGLKFAHQAEDSNLIALLHSDLGLIALISGVTDVSRSHHRLAYREYIRIGDQLGAAASAASLADIETRSGNYEQAEVHYAECLRIREVEQKNINDNGNLHLGQALVAFRRGDYESAMTHVDAQMAVAETLQSKSLREKSLRMRAMIFSDQGSYDEAAVDLSTALAICRELNSGDNIAAVLHIMGENQLRSGRLGPAKAYLERSLRMKRESGNDRLASYTLLVLARLDIVHGNAAEAHPKIEAAQALAQQFGMHSQDAYAWLLRAQAKALSDDKARAREALSKAAELQIRLGEKRACVQVMELAAQMALSSDDQGRALEWLENATRLREFIGAPATHFEAKDLATLREQIEKGQTVGRADPEEPAEDRETLKEMIVTVLGEIKKWSDDTSH